MKEWCKKNVGWLCIAALVLALAILLTVVYVVGSKQPSSEQPEIELQYDDPMHTFFNSPLAEGDDADYDGLLNDEEAALGTAKNNPDTDEDGLGDYYEVKVSLTDPLKADTDGDTLNDKVEILAKLDPTKSSTDGETQDADREFKLTYDQNYVNVKINGDANIYNAYCAKLDIPGLSTTPGVISDLTEIYVEEDMPRVEYKFSYTTSRLKKKGGVEEELSLYKFTNDGTFEKVQESVLDTSKDTVTCTIQESGKYLICDARVESEHNISIMLLIDNSGSMYPPEMCEGSSGNDVDFKRLDMAKSIIENITDRTSYGLAKFTATYTKLNDIGASKEDLFAQIDAIKTTEEEFNGTYIAESIMNACDSFTAEHNKNRKFVIILTDGETTEGKGLAGLWCKTEYDAIQKCNDSNVTVITIALGNETDANYLQKIANGTGGAYIYANNADALTDLYDAIFKSLLYSAEDYNNNGKVDSFITADSGFEMSRNAFAFENIAVITGTDKTPHGICHGYAVLAQAFYRRFDLYSGNAYNGTDPKTHKFTDYDISAQLAKISNLKELKCPIAEKFTAIYNVPSKDRYYNDNGTLRLKPELLAQYKDEYFTVKTQDIKGTFGGKKYTKTEILCVDLEKYSSQDTIRDDMEIIKALYWLWGSQFAVSGKEGPVELAETDMWTNWLEAATEAEFDKVVAQLKQGIPHVVGFDSPAGGHAITAMRMLRDVNNPLVYYLECYDNNDSVNPYYFKIVRNDIDLWNATSASNWGENYCYRTYLLNNDQWEEVSLSLGVINGK